MPCKTASKFLGNAGGILDRPCFDLLFLIRHGGTTPKRDIAAPQRIVVIKKVCLIRFVRVHVNNAQPLRPKGLQNINSFDLQLLSNLPSQSDFPLTCETSIHTRAG